MEKDQHIPKSELDSFSRLLPLPYRVAVILVAGFWGWGINLHYLYKAKIDVPALIRYPPRQSPSQKPHHTSAYHLATLLTIPLVLSILLFWTVTRGDGELVKYWQVIPQSYYWIFGILLLWPFHRLSRSGRYRFIMALKRVSIGGLAEAQDGKFGDILLADALTSYAKVIADLWVSLCMYWKGRGTPSTGRPDRTCGGEALIPIIIAVPSLIRLRQCLIEYVRVRRAGYRGDSWGGQHLANALKYASAIPVIALTALQRNYNPLNFGGMSEMQLYRLWVFFSFINSFYSFYWDVAKDWDLSLFSAARSDPAYPFGLRRHRGFRSDNLYYAAIIIDLILRFTWVCKISHRYDHITELESTIFLLMFLEVARRWMWVFLRVETEWIRNNRGPAPDDILLGEFTGKKDQD
ncbi:hypothetical protein VTN02DRAFT_2697 [Thermoascus thermophilus]